MATEEQFQSVRTEKGNKYTLTRKIGSGGQGAVFKTKEQGNLLVKVKLDEEGFILEDQSEFNKYMWKLISVMNKENVPHLAVPIAALEAPICGYVMQFLDGMEPIENDMKPGYGAKFFHKTKRDLLRFEYIRRGGLAKRIKILRNLANILADLHSKGLVYCDISTKNIFISSDTKPKYYRLEGVKSKKATSIEPNKIEFDPYVVSETANNEVWLIDLDNLAYEGETGCIGTMFYRAPEVSKGHRNTIASDCYSFALLAFEYLTYSKPFEGLLSETIEEDSWDDTEPSDAWDSETDEADFYTKMDMGVLPYVNDETDDSNSQIYGLDIESVSTAKMRELFMRTFSEAGRSNPASRPTMNDWAKVLTDAIYELVDCDYRHSHFGKKCLFCAHQGYRPLPRQNSSYYRLDFYDKIQIVDEDGESSFTELPISTYKLYCGRNSRHDHNIRWELLSPCPEKFGFQKNTVAFTVKIANKNKMIEIDLLSTYGVKVKPVEEGKVYEILLGSFMDSTYRIILRLSEDK